jgi:hypothetical protein
MIELNANAFWTCYREKLRQSDWAGYCTRNWTPIAIEAARRTCQDFGLKTETGYNTCVTTLNDAVGYDWRHCYDWRIRVAFEHELKEGDWKRELCKLTHYVADLRVLVAYCNFRGRVEASKRIEQQINLLGSERLRIVPGNWLIVMGPFLNCHSQAYEAYTLENDGALARLHDELPLVPETCMRASAQSPHGGEAGI